MKKRSLIMGLLLAGMLALTACGGNEQAATNTEAGKNNTEAASEVATEVSTESNVIAEQITEDEIPEGKVVSDLTGEFIDADLENQRPIAVMVDNEKTALPHYGMTEADIVYEMVNSTANDRVTRFMALVKDWESVEVLGSIRSARATNCMLAMEWNAILCHDGGPFYIDSYTVLPSLDNLSGGFSRIPNGKPREFTEYISEGEVAKRVSANNIEKEYNNYYVGVHFAWANEVELAGDDANSVDLPFPHNSSELKYDAEDRLYYYSEYGMKHVDAGNDNAQLCFKNVIIQEADMFTHEVNAEGDLDQNGYMYYQLENSSGKGYYAVNGKVVPITWKKGSLTSPTQYFDNAGNELVLNVGKTYIAIVPSDSWNEVVIK